MARAFQRVISHARDIDKEFRLAARGKAANTPSKR